MIIHFCDKCGNRIPQSQLDDGSAAISDEVRAICAGCSDRKPARRTSQAKIVPASSETSARNPGLHAAPPASRSSASHKVPAAPIVTKATARHPSPQGAFSKAPVFIGAGVVLFLIVLACVLLSGKNDRSATPKNQPAVTTVPQASAPTSAPPVHVPVHVPVTQNNAPDSTATTTAGETVKTDDGYDPRAAVAQSMLAQAKSQATTDPWASHDLLEDLKTRYARTPSADEAVKLLAEWKPPGQLTPPGQSKPRLDGSTDTFLTLSDSYSWRCGHTGKAQEGATIEGRSLRIKSKPFDKGIGFHSIGELNFDLGGHYKWLTGYLGVDSETNGGGSVGYEIWLNGRKAHETGVLRGNDEARFFKLSVDGVGRVRIVVTDGGDDQNSDHADLCRLRVYVGPEEPRDDYTGTETSTGIAGNSSNRSEPEGTTSAPAALSAETLADQTYAQFLTGLWRLLGEKGWTPARARLNDALKNPTFGTRTDALKADRELLALVEKAWDAIPAGANVLKDGRAFTLVQSDGKRYALGSGTKTRVVKVAGSTIDIEQDEGRGKLVFGVSCTKLTFQTSQELARLGLADDGDGKLALALMDWLRPDNKDAEQADRSARKALGEAETAKASAASVARLRAWLDLTEKERAAERAHKDLEGLIEQQKGKEVVAAYEAFRKDHAGTAFFANVQPQLPALETKLKTFQLADGLWVSYWSGSETNRFEKFHFARAETKLMLDWGEGQCDPQVPGDNFGLRIGGILNIPAAGRYTFVTHSDDLMRIWLNGNQISETNCNEQKPELDLQPGPHTFKVEYMEYHGGASLHIRWKPPGAADFEEIPASIMRHKPGEKEAYQKP